MLTLTPGVSLQLSVLRTGELKMEKIDFKCSINKFFKNHGVYLLLSCPSVRPSVPVSTRTPKVFNFHVSHLVHRYRLWRRCVATLRLSSKVVAMATRMLFSMQQHNSVYTFLFGRILCSLALLLLIAIYKYIYCFKIIWIRLHCNAL